MGFSINPHHLPMLRDYNKADAWEKAIKPIRGKTIKPLGDRRMQHMEILRYGEGTPEERIACRLYGTDCVTFYKDGRIFLSHGNYATQSTMRFIDKVFPYGRVSVRDNHVQLHMGGGVYRIPSEGLWVGPGTTIQNIVPFSVHTLNRAAAKAVRGKYAAFKQYAVQMCKLLNGESGVPIWSRYHHTAELPDLSMGEDLEAWYPLSMQLLHASGENVYDSAQVRHIRKTTPVRIARTLDFSILRAHRDEVFEVTTLPDGQYKKDSNAKYFR